MKPVFYKIREASLITGADLDSRLYTQSTNELCGPTSKDFDDSPHWAVITTFRPLDNIDPFHAVLREELKDDNDYE